MPEKNRFPAVLVPDLAHTLRGEGFDASEDGTGRGTPIIASAYRVAGDGAAYAMGDLVAPITTATDKSSSLIVHGARPTAEVVGTLTSAGGHAWPGQTVQDASAGMLIPMSHEAPDGCEKMRVRRLTPRECERLQGFRDDWTLIPLRNKAGELTGKFAKDGPRYKALGNSMAVPVMRWIGERIKMHEELFP